jgi:hypothetical protein
MPRPLPQLWPWRDWMTIGIGVVCTHKAPQDCLILASDKLGTFNETLSTKRHAKLFVEPDCDLFAACAGSVEAASEFLPKVIEQWKGPGARTYGALAACIRKAIYDYKQYAFVMEVLPRYALDLKEDWREVAKKMGIEEKLFEEWNNLDLGFDILIGSHDWQGKAQLFGVSGDGMVTQHSLPGFMAIGTGGPNAMFWLSYREQSLGMSLLRSAYHVFEAKLMAEHSPYVGKDDIEMLILMPTMWYLLNEKNQSYDGCPVSLVELKELIKKFGPSATDSLGGL